MGARLKQEASNVDRQQNKLNDLNHELKLDLAQSAIDIAGIADPTPISDVIGAGFSLFRGDFIGAGLSLISVVPYAGDALGKTAKGARLAKKMAALKKSISSTISAVDTAIGIRNKVKKGIAAKVRAQRAAAAAKKFEAAKKCPTCKPPTGNKYGSLSPKKGGKWSGDDANSTWHPDPNDARGKKVLEATGGKPVKFKDGYPDFKPFAKHRVEIDVKGRSFDDTSARNAVRTKLGDANWEKPENMTWHHHQDGVTMELVPTKLNNNVSHTGGDSIMREAAADPGY